MRKVGLVVACGAIITDRPTLNALIWTHPPLTPHCWTSCSFIPPPNSLHPIFFMYVMTFHLQVISSGVRKRSLCLLQWATRNPRFPFTLCVAAQSTQSSRPAVYSGTWPERAIIDHMYNAALYSGGLCWWCCRPTFPFKRSDVCCSCHSVLILSSVSTSAGTLFSREQYLNKACALINDALSAAKILLCAEMCTELHAEHNCSNIWAQSTTNVDATMHTIIQISCATSSHYILQVLLERRSNCEEVDCDPLVWTNHRLIRWVDSIDLDVSVISFLTPISSRCINLFAIVQPWNCKLSKMSSPTLVLAARPT